jgi:hypothetical protein
MNSKNDVSPLAAAALALSILAFTPSHVMAADALGQFAGNWSGSGKIVAQNGTSERIRCRSNNKASGNALNLSLRCASDSYKFELASDITSDGGNLSGSWNETTRGVIGSLSGKFTPGNIQAQASAVGFNAGLAIRATGNSLGVTIRAPGSEITEVSISMAKGR